MTIAIILIVFVIIMIGIFAENKNEKDSEAYMKARGISKDRMIESQKYIAGHPGIDNPIVQTFLTFDKSNFSIYEYKTSIDGRLPFEVARILKSNIKDVIAEDATTMEKRVTVGRLLVVGLFAFALKKNKKNELAYLTIKWSDGRFEHDTYFEFAGKDAMTKANTARNRIIANIE